MPTTDDYDVKGYERPYHGHPGRWAKGHAHPCGSEPHSHLPAHAAEVMASRLTKARRTALAVLLRGEELGHPVTESNVTTPPDRWRSSPLFVYWQTRAWLDRSGYVTSTYRRGWLHIELTTRGRALARAAAALEGHQR